MKKIETVMDRPITWGSVVKIALTVMIVWLVSVLILSALTILT
jgi:hypothetical protein